MSSSSIAREELHCKALQNTGGNSDRCCSQLDVDVDLTNGWKRHRKSENEVRGNHDRHVERQGCQLRSGGRRAGAYRETVVAYKAFLDHNQDRNPAASVRSGCTSAALAYISPSHLELKKH